MKKIFTLFAMAFVAVCVNAQSAEPVQGVDYTWEHVTSEMTTVPADFCEGVSVDAAKAAMDTYFSLIGCIVGNKPADGENYSAVVINDDWEYETTTLTWAAAAAKADPEWEEYIGYPARIPEPTGINDVTVAKNNIARKVVENGRMLILVNGQKYTVAGARVE